MWRILKWRKTESCAAFWRPRVLQKLDTYGVLRHFETCVTFCLSIYMIYFVLILHLILPLTTHLAIRLYNFIILCGGINGEGGMFSTLRRLSTVSRRPRSKKKMLDFDKDIEMFSDKESGDGNTSGYVRWGTSTNQSPVFRSHDLFWPIRGQYLGHVICLDQSEADFFFVSVEQTRGVLVPMTHPAHQGHQMVSKESC